MIKILEIFSSAAAIQGFFLAFVLFAKKDASKIANIILAGLVIVSSLTIMHSVYVAEYLRELSGRTMKMEEPFILLIGPCIYLYLRTLVDGKNYSRKDLKHLIPFVLYFMFLIIAFIHRKQAFFTGLQENSLVIIKCLIMVTNIILGLNYIHKIIKMTGIHNHTIENEFSRLDKLGLDWVKKYLIAFLLLIIFSAISVVLEIFKIRFIGSELIIPTVIALLIYSFGYQGLVQPDVFRITHQLVLAIPPSTETVVEQPAPIILTEEKEIIAGSEKYRNINIDDESANKIAVEIKKYMETEKPYLNMDFNLDGLSEAMRMNKNNISYILNNIIQSNFFNFVNLYRVEEVKSMMLDPKNQNYTILAIAFDAGFSSKASFNSIFKKYTNMTPSEYRKSKLQV